MNLTKEQVWNIQQGIAATDFSEQYQEAVQKMEDKYGGVGTGATALPFIGDIIQQHTFKRSDIGAGDITPRVSLGELPKTMIEGLIEADEQMEDEIWEAGNAQMINLATNIFLPNVSEIFGLDTTLSDLLGEVGGSFAGNFADKLLKRFGTSGLNAEGVKMTILEAILADLPFLKGTGGVGDSKIAETVHMQV